MPSVAPEDMFDVLDALDDASVAYWVAGGFGVALLLGRVTRENRDLDLLVDANDSDACISVLRGLGYELETDWLPVRAEFAASRDRWVDVHPVVFNADGSGRQEGLEDAWFDYPSSAFATGQFAGRAVRCVSVEQQRVAHAGYTPRPQDVHDTALLDATFPRHSEGNSDSKTKRT